MNHEANRAHQSSYEESARLYENTINWLQQNYSSYRFFTERDIVWTLQLHLLQEIERRHIHLHVFDNYRMPNRVLVDLALTEKNTDSVLVVAEIKYEPDHSRVDISRGKLSPSKVFWDSQGSGVIQDINRIETLIDRGFSGVGYVTFIDEGGHHSWRQEPQGSIWDYNWGTSPYSENTMAVLLFKRQ